MKIEKLKKYCLQYLEQSDDIDVMDSTIQELLDEDTYKEYMLNMDHSIYMALVRFATSKILPLQEEEITENPYSLVDDNGIRKFHEIKEVYSIKDKRIKNVEYTVIGKKILIHSMDEETKYYVVYHPTINDLSTYNEDVNEIELNEIGVPDEMAINIKYLVYSDLKLSESASIAQANKNIFESYLNECSSTQVESHQLELINNDWVDLMAD